LIFQEVHNFAGLAVLPHKNIQVGEGFPFKLIDNDKLKEKFGDD
jgi:hypothetical protein